MKTRSICLPMIAILMVLGATTNVLPQPRMQPESRQTIDSLRLAGFPRHIVDETPNRDRYEPHSSRAIERTLAQSPLYVIDTAIVVTAKATEMHLYSFNTSGKRNSDVIQKLKGGLWVDSLRISTVYDAYGNVLTILREQWSSNQWVNTLRDKCTYDANGNEIRLLVERWSTDRWVNLLSMTYTHGANGSLLTSIVEQWMNDKWVNSSRVTYTYDSAGNVSSILSEYWSGAQWQNTSRDTYTYGVNGNVVTRLYERWTDGQWENGVRYAYTYTVTGTELTFLEERWSSGQWVNSRRDTCSYDANGNVLTRLVERWAIVRWVNSERYSYIYDSNDNLISFSSELWVNSSWTPREGSCYVRDSAGNWYDYYCCNVTLKYKAIVTGIASDSDNRPAGFALSQNYPNPFNPSTTIRCGLPERSHVYLAVYNTLGQEVAQLVNGEVEAGYHEVKFDASSLPSGVYLYRLQAGGYTETKKLLLLR